MLTTILQGVGWFLLKIYEFFENLGVPGAYAIMLVIFTILIKLILFPLSYRGKRSMMRQTALQGKMKQLEAQYGKDRQRYQMEVQKLYQKEGVRPMGGCLWSILPLPIMMALYMIIRRPMVYLMRIPQEAVETAISAAEKIGITFTGSTAYSEIQLASRLSDSGVMETVRAAIPDYADRLTAINFNLFGINLGETPKLRFWQNFDALGIWPSIGLFLIPLAVTVLNFWYTQYSQKTNAALTAPPEESNTKKNKKNKDNTPAPKSQSERSNQVMMWIMPLMYLYFGFVMPASMCVYMAVNAVVTVIQDTICVRMMRKPYLQMLEEQKLRDEREAAELAAKKEAIAERRRLEEEQRKANAKKGSSSKKSKKTQKPAPKPARNTNGRIGIRTYALGRDYDPNRYGPVTAYRDPQEIIDEQAVEKAYQQNRGRRKENVEKAIEQAEEAGDLDRVEALEAEKSALEAAEAAAAAAEDTLPEGSSEAVGEEAAAEPETPSENEAPSDEENDEQNNGKNRKD